MNNQNTRAELIQRAKEDLKGFKKRFYPWDADKYQEYAFLLAEHLEKVLDLFEEEASPPEPTDPSSTLIYLRDTIRAFWPDAQEAIFPTTEWENGYFFSCLPTILFPEGKARWPLDGANLEPWATELSHEYGPLGRLSTLTINLDTLEVSFP